jgi:hypothetical protein
VLSLALGHLVATTVAMQSHDGFGQLKSAASLATILEPLIGPQTPVFAVQAYDQTLPFYLRRHVVLVDYEDEFALGEQLEPGRWIKSLDEFVPKWQALPEAAAYMTPQTWQALQQRGLPMRIVYHDLRRVVVVKP